MTPVDQDALVKQIGLALMRTAPEDWQEIRTEFRAVGRYFELSADVTGTDGETQSWTVPQDVTVTFAKLRAGMYREGRGTWFNARYHIERPSSYNLEFDRLEPQWRTSPPMPAYRDELHMFPRSDDNVPEWLARKLAGLPPERPGRRFRVARIFDGNAPNGRPSVNRPPVPDDDRDRLLDYLDHAPLALPERGLDVDRLSRDAQQNVPVAFHTDGMWVWPAAVNYYLRRYGVPPDPELVNHIRANGFRLPEVDEASLAGAAATITGGPTPPSSTPSGSASPPGAGGPARPAGSPRPAGPPASGAPGTPGTAGTPGTGSRFGQPSPAGPPPGTPPGPRPGALGEALGGGAPPSRPAAADGPDEGGRQDAPGDTLPPPASPLSARQAIDLLQRRLGGFGIPESAYRIGAPDPQTWFLEQADDGWQVGWYDGEFSSPMLFDEVDDAAAYLLGKLLLIRPDGPGQPRPGGGGRGEPAEAAPAEATMLAAPVRRPDSRGSDKPPGGGLRPAFGDDGGPADQPPRDGGGPQGPTRVVEPVSNAPAEWPIQPLRGEPPLTLFRGKRMLELAVGTEIDRFGTPEGNLVYTVGTPFEERSLVPDWVHRPYQVYRVARPLQAVTGIAIPWFDQPGGGTAYLLPRSIEELLETGDIIAGDPAEPPV